MRIISGRVNWWVDYGNEPTLELLVDAVPKDEEFRFERREHLGGNGLYFAERDGLCRFFSWRRGCRDSGFGGSHFTLTMQDGTTETLMGPWSSSTRTMNGAGFPPCVPVSLGFTEGKYSLSGAVLLGAVEEALPRIAVGAGYFEQVTHAYRANFGRPLRERFAFPPGTTCVLERELSDEQANVARSSGLAGGTGPTEFWYVPAARLPDGTVWRKPR